MRPEDVATEAAACAHGEVCRAYTASLGLPSPISPSCPDGCDLFEPERRPGRFSGGAGGAVEQSPACWYSTCERCGAPTSGPWSARALAEDPGRPRLCPACERKERRWDRR